MYKGDILIHPGELADHKHASEILLEALANVALDHVEVEYQYIELKDKK